MKWYDDKLLPQIRMILLEKEIDSLIFMNSSEHCKKPFYKLFVAFFKEFYLCST